MMLVSFWLFVDGVYVHVNSGFLQRMSSRISAYDGGMNFSSSIIPQAYAAAEPPNKRPSARLVRRRARRRGSISTQETRHETEQGLLRRRRPARGRRAAVARRAEPRRAKGHRHGRELRHRA